jgi:hypothetical protein
VNPSHTFFDGFIIFTISMKEKARKKTMKILLYIIALSIDPRFFSLVSFVFYELADISSRLIFVDGIRVPYYLLET